MTILRDGRTGNTMRIDANNRASTSAITEPLADFAAEKGVKFNINTGDITLTNATATSVLYLKNNENSDLLVTALIYNLGNTASGTGDVKIDVIRNPTAGDIVTNANDALVGSGVNANQNYGSNTALSVNAYKGASGETAFSDGAVSVSTRSSSNTGRIIVSLGAVVLPKGASIGVNYTPPTSNTSQITQFAVACYLKNEEVEASK